jgi:hypothetical protein
MRIAQDLGQRVSVTCQNEGPRNRKNVNAAQVQALGYAEEG